MKRRIRATAALMGLAAAVLGGCDISRPEIRFHDVRVESMDFERIDVVYEFEIVNPNSYIITLWAFDYTLVAGGEKFASCTLDKPVTGVPTGGKALVRAPVSIAYKDVPLVVSRPAKPSFYGLNGSADFTFVGAKRSYPFTHAGMILPLRKPSWRFVNLRLANRTEGIIELSFDVENPNTFAIPLGRLAGTLRSGEKDVAKIDRIAPGAAPAGKTARLVVPVRIASEEALRSAAAAEAAPQSLTFVGRLEIAPPPELREMLLGQERRP